MTPRLDVDVRPAVFPGASFTALLLAARATATALILALMGGLVSALFGTAAAVAIAWKTGWPILVISPWAIVLAWGFAGFIGILFGLYPAQRALRPDPTVTLRFE